MEHVISKIHVYFELISHRLGDVKWSKWILPTLKRDEWNTCCKFLIWKYIVFQFHCYSKCNFSSRFKHNIIHIYACLEWTILFCLLLNGSLFHVEKIVEEWYIGQLISSYVRAGLRRDSSKKDRKILYVLVVNSNVFHDGNWIFYFFKLVAP